MAITEPIQARAFRPTSANVGMLRDQTWAASPSWRAGKRNRPAESPPRGIVGRGEFVIRRRWKNGRSSSQEYASHRILTGLLAGSSLSGWNCAASGSYCETSPSLNFEWWGLYFPDLGSVCFRSDHSRPLPKIGFGPVTGLNPIPEEIGADRRSIQCEDTHHPCRERDPAERSRQSPLLEHRRFTEVKR